MKAHFKLVAHAVKDMGYTVSVWDGEEWQVKRSSSLPAIKDAMESVDESQLKFRDADGNEVGWAFIVLGNDGGDEVCDYSVGRDAVAWLNTWFDRVVMAA